MATFKFIDPYQDLDNGMKDIGDQAKDEFNIDVGNSSANIRNLFSDVEQFDIETVPRELANATIAIQARCWKLWSNYASDMNDSPMAIMKKRNSKYFILFLEWYRQRNPTGQRLTSYETLWKHIRELYYDRCKVVMPADVATPVTRYIHTHFCERHSLKRGTLPKYTVGHNTLLGMLHHHWMFDTSSFPIERERVQLAAILLFLGQESMSDIIKEMGKLTLRRDPNLPKKLTPAHKQQAHSSSEGLSKAEANFKKLTEQLLSKYGQITKAPAACQDLVTRNALRTRINSLRQSCERTAFREILKNFHSDADLEQMILQLKGEKPRALSMLQPEQHALPQRNALAEKLFTPADSDTWYQIVDTMIELCSHNQSRSRKGKTTPSPSEVSKAMLTSDLPDLGPLHCFSTTDSSETDLLQHQSEPDCTIIQCEMISSDTAACKSGAEPASTSNPEASGALARKSSMIKRSMAARLKQKVASCSAQKLCLPRNVCLFCYRPNIKNHIFPRRDNLRRHYRTTHFQHQVGSFYCPVPTCETLISDPEHFCAHATSVHRSDIGVYASIMQTNKRKARPGQLQGFRLELNSVGKG